MLCSLRRVEIIWHTVLQVEQLPHCESSRNQRQCDVLTDNSFVSFTLSIPLGVVRGCMARRYTQISDVPTQFLR